MKEQLLRTNRDTLIWNILPILDRHRNEKEMVAKGIISNTTITEEKYTEYLVYLQELKDLPNNVDLNNLPDSVSDINSNIYPTKPI